MIVDAVCLNGTDLYEDYDTSFKAYMGTGAITNTNSEQYKLLQKADDGLFMKYNNRYLVAIGTGWGAIVGDYVTATLDTGEIVECVVGDIKADIHTDDTNRYTYLPHQTHNYKLCVNVLEFIMGEIPTELWASGCVSAVEPKLRGNITRMEVFK